VPKYALSNPKMNGIRRIIKEEMALKGLISFARFMELALYCPNFGYYEQLDVSPGRAGDYFTSVGVGPLFGELLAYQIAGWLEFAPGHDWQIVEAGAHEGLMAADIIRWLQTFRPNIAKCLHYWILEPSTRRRQSQEKSLGEFANSVRWFDSWSAIPQSGVHGFIISNELLDAMPVRRLGWDAAWGKWFEWGVAAEGDNFVWVRKPDDCELEAMYPIKDLPPTLLEVLPDGFTTEVCPAALKWWRDAAGALKAGKLITFDYGLASEQFFTPERRQGTLRAYYRHHQSNDLLTRVGKQDITAQVNFTAIGAAGEDMGLRTENLETQAQFLSRIVAQMSKDSLLLEQWTSARARQFQTLTHPEHLGNSFRVLVQAR
jgi:SAM-dependent MidA family methyltransferase